MGALHVGKVISIKGTVKYVLTGLKSHDRVCITIGNKDIWFEMPKGTLSGEEDKEEQEASNG